MKTQSKKPTHLEPTPLPLSAKEKGVLEYIESVQASSGISPSYQEIQENFGFASVNSVQNYLKQLTTKGYIQIPAHQKRAIQILKPSHSLQNSLNTSAGPSLTPLLQSKEEVLSLPLLGKVAAGQPIEALTYNESFDVTAGMVKNPSKTFALVVSGDSMIDEGIWDGDTILVQEQNQAKNGDIIVATVNNEATVKKFFLRAQPKSSNDHLMVELRPANPRLESMWFSPYDVDIRGIVVGLVRKY